RYGQPQIPVTRPLQQQPDNFDFLVPKGNGDQVRLAKISTSGGVTAWSEVADLTPPGQDVYRPAVAVDGAETVWVVWPQNVGGNWDLYGRPFRNGQLGPTIRITRDEEPDLLPAMAADGGGTTWLAWQGFRGGNSDIFLVSLPRGGERWSE